ncbi:MAG: hypothetical protein LQ349_009801 [Xanthoria aureola]|nr:MAG: hypothetical protein LQ349_009801 [Xanthoria aureola]
MSLVNLAHCCSHLQNASKARLGLTSIPCTTLHHTLMLQLQRSGYITSVTIGGPVPPPPSHLNPILDPGDPEYQSQSQSSEPSSPSPNTNTNTNTSADMEKGYSESIITQANIATRRLWVGLKYWNNEPVLHRMRLVSKPTRRVWMGFREIEALARGDPSGYVKGLRGVGESMYVTTDRGLMEVRDCVEKRTGGMILCRVNGV